MRCLASGFTPDPMLDMFIFETRQLIEQLEQEILICEESGSLDLSINEIFRIMHTIKGSAAMMSFNNISSLAHSIEDLLYFIRDSKPAEINHTALIDIILSGMDFIKNEIKKIEAGESSENNPKVIIEETSAFLKSIKSGEALKNTKTVKTEASGNSGFSDKEKEKEASLGQHFNATVFFEDGSEMENIRAYALINNLKQFATIISMSPSDIAENNQSAEIIKKEGFKFDFITNQSINEINAFFEQVIFLKSLELKEINTPNAADEDLSNVFEYTTPENKTDSAQMDAHAEKEAVNSGLKQSMISVSVSKLDLLMDIVGELVISEAMVVHNPELEGLELDGFYKSARQLHKIIGELQDIVMSIRMVPLSVTFHKMHRIVRDMSHKLQKEVRLEISGEETEVDKNIIEHISDPLMHLIRNSIDHGIEPGQERESKGKQKTGSIILEAKNASGDVWITVKDDGRGLDKDKILKKAYEKGLTNKPENELTDKEIFSFILLPGFSTNDSVTEFSGRGVGMDVVVKNITKIGGTVSVDSVKDKGTTITIKIPLTLAIIDGMVIQTGRTRFIVPTVSIIESFRAENESIVKDTNGNEMIMVRGSCYPVTRLHKLFRVEMDITEFNEGIIVMVESNEKIMCIFADCLIGQQQVVVKALPSYIKKVKGISGCTLLGDGNIGLILDMAGLTS